LLIGRTLNTNAKWAGKRLANVGAMIKEITTVDDDLGEISSALHSSLARSPEFLIVVGGLGPTPDDMTLAGVAKGLGKKLTPNKEALALIMRHYAKRGLRNIEMTPARRKMARLPTGADPLENWVGTAPGVRLTTGRTVIFCLPGVPHEMKWIFVRSVEREVRKRLGKYYRRSMTMNFEGVLESSLAPVIAAQEGSHPEAYIKSHPRRLQEGVSKLELDIVLVGKSPSEMEDELEEISSAFAKAIVEEGGRVISTSRMPRRLGVDLGRT